MLIFAKLYIYWDAGSAAQQLTTNIFSQGAQGAEFCRDLMLWLFCLGISMWWFFSPGISISWLFVLWQNALGSRCRALIVSNSGCRGVLVAESRCGCFLVLESRCRVFLVLESRCRGFLVLGCRCRSIWVFTASFSFHCENRKTHTKLFQFYCWRIFELSKFMLQLSAQCIEPKAN